MGDPSGVRADAAVYHRDRGDKLEAALRDVLGWFIPSGGDHVYALRPTRDFAAVADLLPGVTIMARTMRYDGSFQLAFLVAGEEVCSAGDGTGACEIHGPHGVLRVELGNRVTRTNDGRLHVDS